MTGSGWAIGTGWLIGSGWAIGPNRRRAFSLPRAPDATFECLSSASLECSFAVEDAFIRLVAEDRL